MADNRDFHRQLQDAAPALRTDEGIEDLTTFACEYGFQEAYVRGLRSTFLTKQEYKQLQTLESIEDFKTVLQDTDYVNAMQGLQNPRPQSIYQKCFEKWVKEYEWLRLQSTGKVAAFIDILSHEHLIANVVALIAAVVKGTSPEDVLSHCHPLGQSPYLQSLFTFDKDDSLLDLYRVVLVDMPIGKYFSLYFDHEVKSGDPSRAIQGAFKEVDIVVIADQLRKLWLQDLYNYSESLGGSTWEMMKPMLDFEADRRAIEIVYNSIQTNNTLADPQNRTTRQELFSTFGRLYPTATSITGSFLQVDSHQTLLQAVEFVPEYADALRQAADGTCTLSDALKAIEVKILMDGAAGQGHLAVWYSFSKLKGIELENIRSLANSAAIKRANKAPPKYIPLF